jgi:hypothetical protein
MAPAYAAEASREGADVRGIHNTITIDDDAAGGYEGDYVVIYNPATSSSTSYSTGTMTGLIETSVNANVHSGGLQRAEDERPSCIIDVDGIINEQNRREDPNYGVIREGEPTRATSYKVGDTRSFTISSYNPGSGSSLNFKVLAVGAHCYIWTPSQNVTNYYTLDSIDSSYAQQAADEFDRMYNLMNTSFGNHSNGSNGDGKVSLLFYNIDDGWNGSGGFVAGYFSSASYSYDGMPIINIDTYPGVYYKTSSGNEGKSMDIAYGTACHEYQHCINYSNTSGMSTWLNECFSAAAEEICYPGSSVVSRIQSWENYYFSDNGDWDNPPTEFAYNSDWTLHKGFSMYNWNNNLEMDDTLALYAQVSFFAQYLFTRFGNSIYKQISDRFSSSEPTAITNATGVSCADLVKDFRVAVTANAAQDQFGGIYGFKAQAGYDPDTYHGVENPWSLLSPVVFTGSSCAIKGGGAITVKPVNGVYNPPAGASSSLKYIGIQFATPFTLTAESNNTAWGTVSVTGNKINCTPAAGYYVESCDVISGTASCAIDGNVITVSADSDCTVRVNFAPKPTYTVNFVSIGSAEGTQSALVYDDITLPSSVSNVPDGWTFAGWTADQIAEETAEQPVYYAPGASYTVTGNATLYALFTRVKEGGAVAYELVSAAPADWTGNYVISYLTTTGMYIMKGVTPGSNGAQIENAANAVAYADSGATLTDTTLYNVANDYIFELAPHGSYYSIQSASTGTYIGMDSSSYLSGYTVYTSGNCDWTPGTQPNACSATNAKNGSYPLLSFSTSNYYFWSGSSNTTAAKSVHFWKEIPVEGTYYTTEPVVPHTHAYGEPEWTWAEDYSAATAAFTCDCGDMQTVEAVVTVETTEPTPTAEGLTVYTATVTGPDGVMYTDTREVILPATGPAITGQPTDFTGPLNSYATFHVEAEGQGLTYQWQTYTNGKWVNNGFSTSTSDTLRVKITEARNGSQYRCVITDAAGNAVTSNAVTLTVAG